MRTLSSVISVFFISVVVGAGCSSTPDNGDGGTDASPSDAKPDKVTKDASGDAATCGSKLACEVCDGGFSATQMTAPYANAGLCSAADITAFVTACGANSTQATCDAWQTAEQTSGPDCLSCVFSDQAGPKWGLYVCDSQGACAFNTPGCLDVALGTVSLEKQAGGAGSCGDLYNDAYGCESYSCGDVHHHDRLRLVPHVGGRDRVQGVRGPRVLDDRQVRRARRRVDDRELLFRRERHRPQHDGHDLVRRDDVGRWRDRRRDRRHDRLKNRCLEPSGVGPRALCKMVRGPQRGCVRKRT